MEAPLLQVKNLTTTFKRDDGTIKAVDNISFHINEGEILGIVGESGCGKSVTSLSIMRLVAEPPGKIAAGEIIFEDKDLLKLTQKDMSGIRGKKISMIFQEPMTSLNPIHKIGDQIAESIIFHEKISKKEAKQRALTLLQEVGIPLPEQRMKEYPHQMSGGMRQRVMIALAMACNSKLLIADEPTTALDVTIQAQILKLMLDVNEKNKMSVLMITHDLGVVANICSRIIVMYSGRIMEEANTDELFANPEHPYTHGLLACLPRLDKDQETLYSIPGMVQAVKEGYTGCRFYNRCEKRQDKCQVEEPELTEVTPGHFVRCFYPVK